MSGDPASGSNSSSNTKQEYEAYLRVNEQFAKCVGGGTTIPVIAANDLCSWMANLFPAATTQVCRDQYGGETVDRSGLVSVYVGDAEDDAEPED